MVLMKHISGLLIHFLNDPFASEKNQLPRNREIDFIVYEGDTKKVVFERWDEAWRVFFLIFLNNSRPMS